MFSFIWFLTPIDQWELYVRYFLWNAELMKQNFIGKSLNTKQILDESNSIQISFRLSNQSIEHLISWFTFMMKNISFYYLVQLRLVRFHRDFTCTSIYSLLWVFWLLFQELVRQILNEVCQYDQRIRFSFIPK